MMLVLMMLIVIIDSYLQYDEHDVDTDNTNDITHVRVGVNRIIESFSLKARIVSTLFFMK